jgi:hypothetical protein
VVSWALMVHNQLSMGKQHSGDLLQRTGLYSNKSTWHCHTNPNILSSSTLASQKFTQFFSKPCSLCDVFLADEGNPAERWGILIANLSCGSISQFTSEPGHQEKGQCSQAVSAFSSELQDGLWQCSLQSSGGKWWVVARHWFYAWWWPHSWFYQSHHLRIGLLAYWLVILWPGFLVLTPLANNSYYNNQYNSNLICVHHR